MDLLEIRKHPDKILRKQCLPVDDITGKEFRLFDRMFSTMKHFLGIGLAAPQVGIAKKLIVAEVDGKIIKLANPEILETKGEGYMEEGCLSVPGLGVNIKRPFEIVVKGLNEKGKSVEIKAKGLLARVLQHEIDHLKGRLIIDYMSFFEGTNFRFKK